MDDIAGVRCLETILRFKMTSMEARAYKIHCTFIEQAHKVFPEMSGFSYPKGDPRKTYPFKVCYTLLRRTQHNIRDVDYPLYVRAQLDIIKINTRRTGKEPYVLPNCLIGEKAWKRWLVWKKVYDTKVLSQTVTAAEAGIDANKHDVVVMALQADKKFLTKRLKSLTKEIMQKAVTDRLILRWVATKQISAYYALLSPMLNEWLKERNLSIEDMFHIDFGFYRPGITDDINKYFAAEFSYET